MKYFMLIATCVIIQNSLFLLVFQNNFLLRTFDGWKIVANIWIMLLLWEIVSKLLFSRGCDKLFNEIFPKFYLCVHRALNRFPLICGTFGGCDDEN